MSPLLEERNLVETISVARRYKVRNWLLCALEGLSKRKPGPNMVSELREPFELDWESIAKILSIQCQSNAVPLALQLPNSSCSNCRSRKNNPDEKRTCKYTCNKRGRLIGDSVEEYQKFYETRLSEWSWKLCLEALLAHEPGRQDRNIIRAMVRSEFGKEIMDWE